MVLATDLFGRASTFFLANKVLGQFVTSVEIRPYTHSDHDFIVLVLDFDRYGVVLDIGTLRVLGAIERVLGAIGSFKMVGSC